MKLKNILIVVSDIECSKAFYHDLFGLDVIRDFGENVILTEGLVLQEKKSWENLIGKESGSRGHDMELYFEEQNLDVFLEKLEACGKPIEYLAKCTLQEGGRRVLRLYDPDGHVIEVGEAVKYNDSIAGCK
ncbi:MAG: VOC family protein [Roseburia sp.]|nr:VOC family protein [Roseburia sp.]